MGMYDSGYKDGANAGYKLAIDDILEKLNDFGFKHNIKIHSPKDNIDDIVTLIKFYKLAYENALNEIGVKCGVNMSETKYTPGPREASFDGG